jgi:integrase/recombinase XerC
MVIGSVVSIHSQQDQRMQTLPTPAAWLGDLDAFDRWMSAADHPRSTRRMRNYHLRRFATTTELTITEVTLEDLITYLGARDWKQETRRSHQSTLKSFFRWATLTKRIDDDPTVYHPRVRTTPGLPRPFPEELLTSTLATAPERERLMIRLGAEVGLRSCEICLVNIRDIVGPHQRPSIIAHGKGNKDRRVPLPASLAALIRAAAGENPGGWLFPGKIDGHLSNKRVIELLADTLPGDWAGHSLRHRYGTVTYDGCKDLRAVQKLMGHANPQTTQIYVHINDDALHHAASFAEIA